MTEFPAGSPASPGAGEAESARSAEPGEGAGLISFGPGPHPLADASRPLPSRERRRAIGETSAIDLPSRGTLRAVV